MDRRLAARQRHPLHPALGQPRYQHASDLLIRHRAAVPGRGDEAVSAVQVAPLVDLHQRLAVVPVGRGAEIARGRLSVRGNAACRHRSRLPDMRYLILCIWSRPERKLAQHGMLT